MARSLVVAAVLAGASSLIAIPAQAGDPIAVCAGKGGTLRLIDNTEQCLPNEQKKLFTEWEPEAEEPPDPEDDKAALGQKVEALTKKLAELERKADADVEELTRKVSELERKDNDSESRNEARNETSKTAQRVTAPFEVVGKNGVVILRVAETVSSTNGQGARVTIGAGQSGNYAVRIHKDGQVFVAGIGQSTSGDGLAVVMDQNGGIAANMNGAERRVAVFKDDSLVAGVVAEDRGGTVAVYDGSHAIAYLTKGAAGGNVTAALNSGEGVFSAGAVASGGGEACVNRVTSGGEKRGSCLGIGLPGLGGSR